MTIDERVHRRCEECFITQDDQGAVTLCCHLGFIGKYLCTQLMIWVVVSFFLSFPFFFNFLFY